MKAASKLAIALSIFGMLMPQLAMATTPATVKDVVLHQNSVLHGRLVSDSGAPVANSIITLQQSGRTIATGKTGQDGRFAFSGLRGGVHRVATPQGSTTFRAWTANSAPPAAHQAVLLVNQSKIVRGNLGNLTTGEMIGIGLGASALIVGIIALTDDCDCGS